MVDRGSVAAQRGYFSNGKSCYTAGGLLKSPAQAVSLPVLAGFAFLLGADDILLDSSHVVCAERLPLCRYAM
jgi:hypothetical protein